MINACVVQCAFVDDIGHNRERIGHWLEQAAGRDADLVVLPELHNGRYFCQQEDTAEFDRAESVPGPTTDWLGRLAAAHGMVIVGSVFERRAAGLYHNTAVVLDSDGSLAGIYRKMHVPDDPGYHEKFYFAPGDLGFRPVDTRIGRLGVLVCWDQWFPEAARSMALAGADMLIYPAAIGRDPTDDADEQQRQLDSWITVQRGHAIANGIPLLAANRCGHEADPAGCGQGIDFWGHSFICGPQGEILAMAGDDDSGCRFAVLDPVHAERVRRIWPFFRDRRIDAYTGLTARWLDTMSNTKETNDE